jgi:hypothetical protein
MHTIYQSVADLEFDENDKSTKTVCTCQKVASVPGRSAPGSLAIGKLAGRR